MSNLVDEFLDSYLGSRIISALNKQLHGDDIIEGLEKAETLLYGSNDILKKNPNDLIMIYPYDTLEEANTYKEKLIKLLTGEITYDTNEENEEDTFGFSNLTNMYNNIVDDESKEKEDTLSLEEEELVTIARRLVATYEKEQDEIAEIRLFLTVVIYLQEHYKKLEFILDLLK